MDEDMPEGVAQVTPSPGYQVLGPKVVVSKAFGKNVERRKQAAIVAYEQVRSAWDEAYRYYNHNQVKDDIFRSSADRAFRSGDGFENLVYANTSTMIPAIYAKNPDVAFSTDQDEDKAFAKVLARAVNAIFNKKTSPGINLKPRMKKAALHAELTNLGIVKLDYIRKEDSREAAEFEIQDLYTELEKAKDMKIVKELEGKMQALESQMEWMEPSGFKLSNVFPRNLIIDPCAENEDGSDANWMLEEIYLSTDFLNAKFTTKKKDEFKSIYKPSHKVKLEGPGSREDALGMVLEAIEGGKESAPSNIDEQQQSYIYQNMTKCYYYWDKTTRRIYLFADNDWTWPIWAWEDELRTSRFYPYFFVQFAPATGGVVSPGEVSYYLDQQDEVNKINREVVRIRRAVFNILVYNNNKIKPDDAKKLANYLKDGTGDNVLGIDVPDGMSIKDGMETLAPPSINYKELFDKGNLYAAIDRISSVNDAIRGAQFKTNTTEDAVQAYTSAARIRVGNKTDAVEDCVQDLSWTIAEILVSKVPTEVIRGLVGDKLIADWKSMEISDLNASMTVKVAAGSSEKPTSTFKKKEAIQIAQAVGQFAKAAPGAALKIILKLLKGAFPELDVTDEDWEAITQETMMQLQRGTSAEGAPQPPGASEGQGGKPNGLMNVPDNVKAMVVDAVNKGATPQQALQPVMEKLNASPKKEAS
jgi:hypothetical protein